ncbi:MAG: asparagine synthase (glutamine-hydrolyzing) [Ignavibacteriae bacterium]|nr:MAG: asparagine synthase (glutamine-hydrolyzing) [Ignavibacteriota bacterium]
MCGISGIMNLNNAPAAENAIGIMNELIHHRGPDGDGIFVQDNVALGNTRLAIIDLRHEADQPMHDSTGRYVIVYNGEIFNYVELRNELLEKGYKFNNNSDTEVILNLYKEYGTECQHKLNGMWALAIWDKKEKTLFCSRDRYGIKPFYYYLDNNRFIFGSEIKQIFSQGVEKTPDDETIYDYLLFNFIDHNEQTFFKNIRKLPAGYQVIIKNNNVRVSGWYKLNENLIDVTDEKKLYKDFYDLIYDSVRIRLRSDVEVGSCLSGGLDSSTIVCLMHDILKNEGKTDIQKTYTAAYDDPALDERKYVEEVLNQTNSAKYYLFPESSGLLSDFGRMVWHQEEPFTSASIYAQWCVFKKIHESGIKVVLDGQGSDEILLGYFSFFPFYLKRLMYNPFKFASSFLKGVGTTQQGLMKFSQSFVYFNSPSIRYKHVLNEGENFYNEDFVNNYNRKAVFEQNIGAKNLSANRMANLWNISLPSLLRYEDKNSMAFSVEARLPFLDHRLVEFIFSIPYDYLIRNGWTKFVLRESMKNEIPEDIRLRKGKLAFSVPQKKWLKEISSFIEDTFNDDFKSGKYINKNTALKLFNGGNYNDKLFFRAFTLEKWMKVFNLQSE